MGQGRRARGLATGNPTQQRFGGMAGPGRLCYQAALLVGLGSVPPSGLTLGPPRSHPERASFLRWATVVRFSWQPLESARSLSVVSPVATRWRLSGMETLCSSGQPGALSVPRPSVRAELALAPGMSLTLLGTDPPKLCSRVLLLRASGHSAPSVLSLTSHSGSNSGTLRFVGGWG